MNYVREQVSKFQINVDIHIKSEKAFEAQDRSSMFKLFARGYGNEPDGAQTRVAVIIFQNKPNKHIIAPIPNIAD